MALLTAKFFTLMINNIVMAVWCARRHY